MTEPYAEPLLLTPGPVRTAPEVKEAMAHDFAPAGVAIQETTARIRRTLLDLVNGDGVYECVPLQGSGTYVIEAAFHTLVPGDGKVLVIANGFYGLRLRDTLKTMGKAFVLLELPMLPLPTAADVEAALDADPSITHMAMCHCDTGTGVLNPLAEIAGVAKKRGIRFIVDAVASFGGFEIDAKALDLEAVVSGANKCLESVPGIGFVIAKRDSLEAAKGNSPSMSLDAHDQWAFMEETGLWRFTPPTQVIRARGWPSNCTRRKAAWPGATNATAASGGASSPACASAASRPCCPTPSPRPSSPASTIPTIPTTPTPPSAPPWSAGDSSSSPAALPPPAPSAWDVWGASPTTTSTA